MTTHAFCPQELESFQEHGFAVARGLIDESWCERIETVVRRQLPQHTGAIEYEAELQYPGSPSSLEADGGHTVRRLKQAVSRDPVFIELVTCPEVTGRLHQLLGPRLVMPLAHHNCVMTKQPGFSSDTGWHQDFRYWSFETTELVSVWLALGEENEANGCLQVIPGTHRLDIDRQRLDDELFLREDVAENAALVERRQFVELRRGDVLFFHCCVFHAATRNHSDVPKLSVVFTFRPAANRPLPGTRSASLPELLIP